MEDTDQISLPGGMTKSDNRIVVVWWMDSSVSSLGTAAATRSTAAATRREASSSAALAARPVALKAATTAARDAATVVVVSTTVGTSLRPAWLNGDALALDSDRACLDGGLAAGDRSKLNKSTVLKISLANCKKAVSIFAFSYLGPVDVEVDEITIRSQGRPQIIVLDLLGNELHVCEGTLLFGRSGS